MIQSSSTHIDIVKDYQHNIEVHETIIGKLERMKKSLAFARLMTVLGGAGFVWYFWPATGIVLLSIVLFSIIFVILVFVDADKSTAIDHRKRLILINQHELDAMQQNLHNYEDGQIFADPSHAYASDLDLFGTSSLYQYVSRCHAEQSKKLLSDYLKKSLPVSTIYGRQKAASELSEKQDYCQNMQASAMADPLTMQTEEKLKLCFDAPPVGFLHPFWKWYHNIYPIIPLSVISVYVAGRLSDQTFLIFLSVFYIISILISRKAGLALGMLSEVEPEIEGIRKQFMLIESEKFRSAFLQSLQQRLKPPEYKSTSAAIGEFVSILKKIDWRSNLLVNLILQIFFLWDLRLVISLNDWKRKNKNQFKDWFSVVAEMEVAVSLASLVRNEPAWCFPVADDKYFHFEAEQIGHPLLPETTRVANDFSMEGIGKIALITGSNMAGKSTFLRSLGINTVLALMGAPVCAKWMNLSEMKLMSSMRVADNLAENTSTFYAELKKIQYIIESVNKQEKVFILLDEVLRGTNSTDRHKGSKALVRQLLQNGAIAVMATHDTELAHSESMNPSVSNYHFEGKIEDEELYFDYKIKPGISESLNATTLMKKIGIHFQD
jgi:phosphatidylglycerophosphatase A